MPVPALPATCPFVRRLIVLLAADLPPSPFMTPDLTFRLLCELQDEAEHYGASEPSRRAIARVCQWAGDSLGLSKPQAGHTRSALPTVYRTVYHSGDVTVGSASSAGSLLSAIETARAEMIRHGADAAQIVDRDGLGAVVWSGTRMEDKA
ncbi:hypothetical protein [Methylobacterium sp. ARG-1]|uniref:hypothetical protein n=1 Tax=Methylobacterium sp. ARG-1 TaxID=1692501 RepID=UPI0006830F8F|nr:hypothetical protein [Methylobacterium sp. ARG-1]KNY19213.1 hypothetical protein AKJ13_28980 [Methylobacterium sp. ARG-1]